MVVKPKQYFEKYHNKNFNKKHKGVKKKTLGMTFPSYANRIIPLNEYYHKEIKKTQKLFKNVCIFRKLKCKWNWFKKHNSPP